jgi:hypothetical protein
MTAYRPTASLIATEIPADVREERETAVTEVWCNRSSRRERLMSGEHAAPYCEINDAVQLLDWMPLMR